MKIWTYALRWRVLLRAQALKRAEGSEGFALTKRLMRGSTNFRLVNPRVTYVYIAQNPDPTSC